MNTTSLVETLGTVLLHSLWQAIPVAAIAYLVAERQSQAAMRYRTWLTALFSLPLFSFMTFYKLVFSDPGTMIAVGEAVQNLPRGLSDITATSPSSAADLSLFSKPIAILWILGVTALSCSRFGGWWVLNQWRVRASTETGVWQQRTKALASLLGLKRKPILMVSDQIGVPMTFGRIKPVILIPLGMLSNLSQVQIEALLMHEMAHILRRDYLFNAIQLVVETLYFHHPLVWFMAKKIREERETASDDIALQMGADPRAFAQALAHFQENIMSNTIPACAATGKKHQLLERIRRIVGMEPGKKKRSGITALSFFILAATLLVPLGFAQRAEQPAVPAEPTPAILAEPSPEPESAPSPTLLPEPVTEPTPPEAEALPALPGKRRPPVPSERPAKPSLEAPEAPPAKELRHLLEARERMIEELQEIDQAIEHRAADSDLHPRLIRKPSLQPLPSRRHLESGLARAELQAMAEEKVKRLHELEKNLTHHAKKLEEEQRAELVALESRLQEQEKRVLETQNRRRSQLARLEREQVQRKLELAQQNHELQRIADSGRAEELQRRNSELVMRQKELQERSQELQRRGQKLESLMVGLREQQKNIAENIRGYLLAEDLIEGDSRFTLEINDSSANLNGQELKKKQYKALIRLIEKVQGGEFSGDLVFRSDD